MGMFTFYLSGLFWRIYLVTRRCAPSSVWALPLPLADFSLIRVGGPAHGFSCCWLPFHGTHSQCCSLPLGHCLAGPVISSYLELNDPFPRLRPCFSFVLCCTHVCKSGRNSFLPHPQYKIGLQYLLTFLPPWIWNHLFFPTPMVRSSSLSWTISAVSCLCTLPVASHPEIHLPHSHYRELIKTRIWPHLLRSY